MDDPAFKYVWFDFHSECKKMKYENLSKLVLQISTEIEQYGSFSATLEKGFDERAKMANEATKITAEQRGVIRTNCMDCLDRTNVV